MRRNLYIGFGKHLREYSQDMPERWVDEEKSSILLGVSTVTQSTQTHHRASEHTMEPLWKLASAKRG